MEAIQFPADRTLTTPDLVLRPILATDAAAYYALCSDEVVMRTWGTPPHRTLEDTHELIRFLDDAFQAGTMIRWAITRKGDDRLIGDVGFWRFVRERYRGEVGAKIVRDISGKGYMTQALTAVVAFGLEKMNLHSVEANVDPTNAAALRLVEKVGFQKEGYLTEHSYDAHHRRFTDTCLFSIVKGRWNPR